jgi:hypothetical protein
VGPVRTSTEFDVVRGEGRLGTACAAALQLLKSASMLAEVAPGLSH